MSAAGQSLEMKPAAPAARAAFGLIRPAPEISSTLVSGDSAPQPLADLGARLLPDEQVDERDVRLVAASVSAIASSPLRALRQRSTHGCSPSISRSPQCTTSWSSTTSTRSLRSPEPEAIRLGLTSGTLMRHRQSHAPGARLALAELDEPADLQRLERREPQPHARTSCARPRTPSLQTSITHAPSCLRERRPRPASAPRACCALRTASTSTDCASASSSRGTPTSRCPAASTIPSSGWASRSRSTSSSERRLRLAARRGRAAAAARGAGRAAPACSSTVTRSRASGAAARRSTRRAGRRTAAGSRPRGPRARGRSAPAAGARARPGTSRGARPRPARTVLPSVHSRSRSSSVSGRRGRRSARITPLQRPPAESGHADERRRRRAGRGSARAPRARPPRRPSRSRGPRRAPGARSAPTRR